MPLYEYLCPACQTRFERLRPMGQANEAVSCPSCQNGARRVLSVFTSFSKSAAGTTTALAGGRSCACCAGGNCAACG